MEKWHAKGLGQRGTNILQLKSNEMADHSCVENMKNASNHDYCVVTDFSSFISAFDSGVVRSVGNYNATPPQNA